MRRRGWTGRIAASIGVVAVAVAVALAAPPGAQAAPPEGWQDSPTPPDEPPVPTEAEVARSVRVFEIDGVRTVDSTAEKDGETTISLAADILFEPDAWDVPGPARDRISELVAEIPEGGEVEVTGHTDSVQGAVDNQELSENRAQAVADVITDARSDLDLSVEGFADDQPAVQEDPEDASTRAANRRVEITFES